MCVYFIQAEVGGLIKIGYSINPITRLYNIQLMCPIKLELKAVIKDASYGTERQLHDDLRASNEYGEWFKPTTKVLEAMANLADPFNEGDFNPPTFKSEEKAKVGKYTHRRCKGFSKTKNRRCGNPANYDGFCHTHKP